MFKLPTSRKRKLRREARSLAGRGLHRAEELREALPEPAEVLSELRGLRGQAQPIVEAAREQAEKARHRGKRSRKPVVIAVAIAVGVAIAYLLFSRRDKEPAFLMPAPQTPVAPVADEPGPGGTEEPVAPSANSEPSWNGTAERTAGRSDEPVVAPTARTPSPGSTPATEAVSPPGTFRPSSNGASGNIPPRSQAAWDLPPGSGPSAGR